jgi:hypothetical protein
LRSVFGCILGVVRVSDLLKKAKALAALEAGIAPVTRFGLAYYAAQFQDRGPNLLPSMVPVSDEYDTATDALAAAADALGLTTDPSISGGVLTETQDEALRVLIMLAARYVSGEKFASHEVGMFDHALPQVEPLLLNRLKGGA